MPLMSDAEDNDVLEPASVSPTSADSRPSSDTPPGTMAESTSGTGDEDGGQSEAPEPLPEFPEESKKDFEGILFLGALTKEFTFAGHVFMIRTLTTGEILSVGQIIKDYDGSLSQMKAYATAVCAATTLSLDGQSLPTPIRDTPGDEALRHRFNEVVKWYPPVIDYVYGQFLALEAQMNVVFASMGKASG